jgi:hypothetical protein
MKAFVANELRSLRDQQRHLEVHISACEVLLEQVRDSDRFTIEWALIKGDFDVFFCYLLLSRIIILIYITKNISTKKHCIKFYSINYTPNNLYN